VITDDNQLLAYGKERFERYHRGRRWGHRMSAANLALVEAAAAAPDTEQNPLNGRESAWRSSSR
jgi:hypothetical protein